MSGTIQSSNYVPGVSGWKFNKETSEFEIHSSSEKTCAEPKLITVTAGSWSDYDLPSNALQYHEFIGRELEKIPADFRGSAELKTEDISFDRDGSDVRTTLTYERTETPDEIKSRIHKESLPGRLNGLAGGNFSIFHDGQLRVRFGTIEDQGPFIVAEGKVYVREQTVKGASINSLTPSWSMKLDRANGRWICAGMGIGVDVNSSGVHRSDIIVKAASIEMLPDGMVKIKQSPD